MAALLLPLFCTLAIGIAPAATQRAAVARERVDLIEVNHFIDREGREVFRQVLFYDWSASHRQYHVRAWRLIKNESQLPRRTWNPPGYLCVWNDEGILREVTASTFRETWTQHDPERANRKHLPEDRRVPLGAIGARE